MKIALTADIHFCKRESLVDNRYPFLKKSIEWADSLPCDYHFDLGDFFNTSHLSAEDVAVLDSVKFKNEWHCITGNHEQDGQNSLLKYFRDLHVVYERPQLKNFGKGLWVLFIPYSKNPTSLDELLKKLPQGEQVMVCSHCDFVGMFGTEEGEGYSLDEINADNRIKVWMNGHYHQRMILSNKVIVVGNLCGQNFTQNFDPHGVCVYDTDENSYEFVDNPYALVFGRMDTSDPNCRSIRKVIENDPEKRFVLAIQTDTSSKTVLKDWADEHLVASRIMLSDVGKGLAGLGDGEIVNDELTAIDHIALFKQEVAKRFGEEIANEIC